MTRLVAVIRPSGRAIYHRSDCATLQRARRAVYSVPEDFSPGDVCCAHCLPCGIPTLGEDA